MEVSRESLFFQEVGKKLLILVIGLKSTHLTVFLRLQSAIIDKGY